MNVVKKENIKVLVISNNAFSSVSNNGKTYASLFDTFPLKNLAQLYFGTNENPDLRVCSKYYRITEFDILKSLCNLSFKTTNTHSKLIQSKEIKSNCDQGNKFVNFIKKHSSTFALFREIMWSLRTWDTDELDNWLRDFKPDIIFAVLGGSIFVHKITLKLSQRFSIPYVVFYTDDYYINDISKNLLQKWHYKLLRKQYKITNKNASLLYTIGDMMSMDYSKEFKRKFGVLINSIDFENLPKNECIKIDFNKDVVISFIGGLHLNRWKSIVELGKVINEINEENGYRIIIKVFTVQPPEKSILELFNKLPIMYCGSLSKSEVLNQLKISHLLLHVESLDKSNRLYTKYSISTKIPEYLSSNRGIIAYGPHEVASIKLLESKCTCGCVLTDLDSKNEMKTKIITVLNKYNTYDFTDQYKFAYENFNKECTVNKLLMDIINIIKK